MASVPALRLACRHRHGAWVARSASAAPLPGWLRLPGLQLLVKITRQIALGTIPEIDLLLHPKNIFGQPLFEGFLFDNCFLLPEVLCHFGGLVLELRARPRSDPE